MKPYLLVFRTAIVLMLIVAAGTMTRPAAAQQLDRNLPILRGVTVLGLDPEQEQLARRAVLVRTGQPLSQYDLDRLEDRLDASDLPNEYRKIHVRAVADPDKPVDDPMVAAMRNGVELFIDYTRPPRVERLQFFLLIEAEEDKFLTGFPLRIGDDYLPADAEHAKAAIRETARVLGYDEVEITPHHVRSGSDTIDLGYFIADPDRTVTLDKMRFDDAGWGNAVGIRRYLREMEEDPIDEDEPITPEDLIRAEILARDLLRAQGYLETTARLEETELRKDGLRATYQMNRGERYKFGTARASGAVIEDPEFWTPATEKFAERKFTGKRLKELEESIRRRAQTEGYMEPEIDLDFLPSRDDKIVDVRASVVEGTTSVLNGVRIERRTTKRGYGDSWYHRNIAPPVKEELIRRQVRVREGEDLNRTVLQDAERRLWRLGVFRDVYLDTEATTDTLKRRDIIVEVEERRTASFGASIGWNEQVGPVVRGSFSESNVGGRADVLSASGWGSLRGDGFGGELSYFNRNWEAGEDLIGYDREPSLFTAIFLNEYAFDQYREERVGGRIGTTYLTGERYGPWSNTWRLRAEQIDYDLSTDEDRFEEDFNSYFAGTLAFHLTYDTRDRGDMDSTEGWLVDSGIEAGTADGVLLKWINTAEYHERLDRNWGWLSRAQVGLMPTDAEDIGLSDRYFLGGLSSVRGFENRGAGPVDGKSNDLQIGGATLVSMQNELRYHASENVEVPVFFDVGTLDEDPLRFGDPRASFGLGLRVKLPDTNQRAYIYLAENVLEEETDDIRRVHFGFTFGF